MILFKMKAYHKDISYKVGDDNDFKQHRQIIFFYHLQYFLGYT